MASSDQKIEILIIQALEHAGIAEDVIGPLKTALEKKEKKFEGSTLHELFCSATGEGQPPAQAPPPAGRATQKQTRQSMQGQQAPAPAAPGPRNSQMGGSVSYNAQQAAMIQRQVIPDQKPVIAKEPDVRNPKLDEQLMTASKSGAVDTIPGLINGGAYVNFQDSVGTSPLLAATEADKVDVVKVLLQNGADVNLARPDGTSPLLAAYKGNKKKVLKELTAGAFRTLNSAVHQTGTIGAGAYYDPGEEEGITQMDMCQLRDEANKLFALQAHPPEIQANATLKPKEEEMVQIGGAVNMGDLRQGGVRLLMQELCQNGRKIS